MHTTLSLVEDLISHFDNCSYYGLAKKLGVGQSTLQGWRKNRSNMSEPTAAKAAEILGIDVDEVFVCLSIERTQGTPESEAWKHLYERLGGRLNEQASLF